MIAPNRRSDAPVDRTLQRRSDRRQLIHLGVIEVHQAA